MATARMSPIVWLTVIVPVVTPAETVTGPESWPISEKRQGGRAGVAELVIAVGIVGQVEPGMCVGERIAVGGHGTMPEPESLSPRSGQVVQVGPDRVVVVDSRWCPG